MRNLLRISGGIPGIRAPRAAEARAGLYRAEALFARGVRECEAARPVSGRPAGGQRATAEGAHGAGSGAGRAAAGAGEKRLAQVGESRGEPPVGFEPTTTRLRIESSTPELRWLMKRLLCQCPGADSNRYAFRHHPLKMACLPISPPGQQHCSY